MTAAAIAGSAVLLLSSIAIGHETVRSKNVRIRHIRSLVYLVRFIRSNITYFLTPLDGLFSKFDDEDLNKTEFCDVLRREGLEAALRCGALRISRETEMIMNEFAAALGKGLKDEEINLCDYTIGRLTEEEQRENDELERCRDVYRYVPPLSALFLILCLI